LIALNDFTVHIDNLDGTELGWESPGIITIDADGAGYGWFIDTTPFDDVEFAGGIAVDPAALGKVDLLSAVMHEIGHVLGYDHDTDQIMSETLGIGMRTIEESSSSPVVASEVSPSRLINWDAEISTLALGWKRPEGGANFPVFSLEGTDKGERQPSLRRKWADWHIED